MPPILPPNYESPGGAIKTQASVPYDHSCWAQAGEAIGVSLLDAYGHNCHSRLPASRYGCLARLLNLSPSFNSHRGQYGPPDNMMEILGATYTSVFEQQLPCRHAACCWQQPMRVGASPTGVLGSPAPSMGSTAGPPGSGGRSTGHTSAHQANASLGFVSPWSSFAVVPTSAAARCAVPFADLAASATSVPSRLASAFEVKGGKPSVWAVSYKSSVPGARRHHRATPPHPSKGHVELSGGAAKGNGTWSRGSASSSKSGAEQKPLRSSTHRHPRATRTASTGALIVAGGTCQRISAAAGGRFAAPPWSSHR